MRRREFISLLGGAAAIVPSLLRPLPLRAQPAVKAWRISHVLPGAPTVFGLLAKGFEQRLLDLGYVAGKDLVLTTQFCEPNELEQVVAGLLRDTDLLVTWTTLGGLVAKKLAGSLPVVFMGVGAPVDIGLVASLAHPGGNMTGVTFEAATETYGKRLQILTEIVPNLSRAAVLRTVGDANVTFAMRSLTRAAGELSVTLLPVEIRSADDLEQAFAMMDSNRAQAFLVIATAVTYWASRRIAELALAHHLPACHPFRETVAAGGLVSLSPDANVMAWQGANYVSKIMKGAKPSELPVEQPTQYKIHINLKTAKALGLEVPATLLARADEVIE
jgi:putative ABC transport system substrate-binding protein